MAVTSSGMIDLNAMHVEAGGTSGAACTLNDSDIRGLIGKASGSAMNFSEWYGASYSEVQTVTVGTYYDGAAYVPFSVWGFQDSPSSGSITDGTLGVVSNAAITQLLWNELGAVNLQLTGSHANSGWVDMVIGGTTFARSAATYTNSTTNTIWSWATTTNPFGTTVGVTKTVNFT